MVIAAGSLLLALIFITSPLIEKYLKIRSKSKNALENDRKTNKKKNLAN
jgi:hypothetical protein